MTHGMELSPQAARILEQCRPVYLHKPSGKRYCLAVSVAGANELHPISGPCRYASDNDLANANIWEKQP